MVALRKIFRIAAGFALIVVGLILALPGVPGPGLAIAVMGLVILADHFTWARRWVDWGKEKLHKMREKKKPAPTSDG